MNIKQLPPQRDSRFKQGVISPESCKKLFESQRGKPIIYRSSWERSFITWCERNEGVERWGSECVGIPYYCPLDKKNHTYYPDFCLEMKDGRKIVVEIKPKNQVEKPDPRNTWMVKTWVKNMSKWRAVKEICSRKDIVFWIITEDTIKKMI